DAYAAVRRYNNSDSYARTVLAIAQAYREGKTMLPLADLPAATGGGSSARSTSKAGTAGRSTGQAAPGKSSATPSATGAPSGSNRGGPGGAPHPGGAVSSIVS